MIETESRRDGGADSFAAKVVATAEVIASSAVFVTLLRNNRWRGGVSLLTFRLQGATQSKSTNLVGVVLAVRNGVTYHHTIG